MKDEINIYYYSGTGNTLIIIKEMVRVFKENRISINLHKIENTDPALIRTDKTVGLAFPVAFQSTFPFLWDFFRALPECNGTEIFMVDTMMSFSGAIVGPLKKILKKKGYNCIGAKEIIMPSNWFPKKINEEKNKRKIKKGIEQAEKYALNLVNGKTAWHRYPGLSDLFYRICCNNYMMKNFNTAPGRKITVNRDKCKGCGLCSRLCPVGNITMNGFPVHSDKCETCMRCLSFCPNNAVLIPNRNYKTYRAVKDVEIIKDKKGAEDEVA